MAASSSHYPSLSLSTTLTVLLAFTVSLSNAQMTVIYDVDQENEPDLGSRIIASIITQDWSDGYTHGPPPYWHWHNPAGQSGSSSHALYSYDHNLQQQYNAMYPPPPPSHVHHINWVMAPPAYKAHHSSPTLQSSPIHNNPL
ncbi:hypothetical protein L208DRAFT_1419578, partial [Tricholoma matsutake]